MYGICTLYSAALRITLMCLSDTQLPLHSLLTLTLRWLTHSTHFLTHSFKPNPNSLIHWLTHWLTHSLTHSLPHWPTHWWVYDTLNTASFTSPHSNRKHSAHSGDTSFTSSLTHSLRSLPHWPTENRNCGGPVVVSEDDREWSSPRRRPDCSDNERAERKRMNRTSKNFV